VSVGRIVAAVVGLAALALLSWQLPLLMNDYFVRVLIVMCINAILVTSMGVSNGFTGVFSLAHVGFAAVGAYVSGILSLSVQDKASYLPDLPEWLAGWNLDFLPSTLAAGLACLVLALLVGAPLMRLSGYFVSVATLGFLIIVNVVLVNANDFTRGARTFTGVPVDTTLPWAAGWLVVTVVVLARIAYSPKGRAFRAVREDIIAAQAIGISVLRTRLLAFATGAFFAGIGGSLYGHYLGSFSPAGFYFAYTFDLIAMLVIGGMQSLSGALTGVIVVMVLKELLRNLERGFTLFGTEVPARYGAAQIVLGVIFILVMIFRPRGLLGDFELSFRGITGLFHNKAKGEQS
jgi:branched-chain amino acid transport system permease protein